MRINENRGHMFTYDDEFKEVIKQNSELPNSIFDSYYKETVGMYKPKTPEMKTIIDALLDEEDENHNLFVFVFNTVYGIAKMIEDYAKVGIVKIDYEKIKWAKDLFNDNINDEQIQKVKDILNQITIDDLAAFIISCFGIAVNNDYQFAAFSNAFFKVDESDNFDQILEKNVKIFIENIMAAKLVDKYDENEDSYIRFISEFYSAFTKIFKLIHTKEIIATIMGLDFELDDFFNEDNKVEYEVSEEELERARKFAVDFADAILSVGTELTLKQASILSNEQVQRKTEQWRKMEEMKQNICNNPIVINFDEGQDDTGKKPYQKK